MHDVVILEAAHHVHNGINLPDVAQELVAEPLTLRRTLDEASNVDILNLLGDDLRRARQVSEFAKARIRHRGTGHIRLNGAEGEVLGVGLPVLAQGVEKRALANVWEAHHACLQTSQLRPHRTAARGRHRRSLWSPASRPGARQKQGRSRERPGLSHRGDAQALHRPWPGSSRRRGREGVSATGAGTGDCRRRERPSRALRHHKDGRFRPQLQA
mmetsp:Transcript_58133/g.165239  ORF Transcript_58133/g.165239 Transcript_58133/m.165239 type:complete len:214 (+) Transcript_58133:811-1452(+)